MQLAPGGVHAQLRQSLRNSARVLAACGAALPTALSVVLFVSEAVEGAGAVGARAAACFAQSAEHDVLAARATPDAAGSLLPGLARRVQAWCEGRQLGSTLALRSGCGGGNNNSDDESGTGASSLAAGAALSAEEAEEAEAERQFSLGAAAYPPERAGRGAAAEALAPPLLILVVPALPRGALVEVEVAAVAAAAAATTAAEAVAYRTVALVTPISGAAAPAVESTSAALFSLECASACVAAAWRPLLAPPPAPGGAGAEGEVEALVAALAARIGSFLDALAAAAPGLAAKRPAAQIRLFAAGDAAWRRSAAFAGGRQTLAAGDAGEGSLEGLLCAALAARGSALQGAAASWAPPAVSTAPVAAFAVGGGGFEAATSGVAAVVVVGGV